MSDIWPNVEAVLSTIWNALQPGSRPLTTGNLSEAYARISRLCTSNFQTFFRQVYGDWDAEPDASTMPGECASWARRTFSQCALPISSGSSDNLATLMQLSRRVGAFQAVCRAVFSMSDKQRLERSRTLSGGSSPTVHEIIELVYWDAVLRPYQQQLAEYACRELGRIRAGEMARDNQGLWASFRHFKASGEGPTMPSPKVLRLREERRRLYRAAVVDTYTRSMLAYYERESALLLSTSETQKGYCKWAVASMAMEDRFLNRSGFPVEFVVGARLSLLRMIAARNLPYIIGSATASPSALLELGDYDGLGDCWKLCETFVSFDGHVLGDRRRADMLLAGEQHTLLHSFGQSLFEGARAATTSKVTGGPDSATVVAALTAQWRDYRRVATTCFHGYGGVAEKLRVGVQSGLQGLGLPAFSKAVAAYIDARLADQSRSGDGEGEFTASLADLVALTDVMGSVDVFCLELKNLLGARLLHRADEAALTLERLLLGLLRVRQGCQSLAATQMTMLNDVERGGAATESFTAYLTRESMQMVGTGCAVSVLKRVNWSPFVQCVPMRNACLGEFQRLMRSWHLREHSSLNLESGVEMTVAVRSALGGRIVEFTGTKADVNDVLLAVSRCKYPPTITELADALECPPRDVARCCNFLRAKGAFAFINGDRAITAATRFIVAVSPALKVRKVSITPLKSAVETAAADESAGAELDGIRQRQLQIALVRVMKRRKDEAVPHDVLVSECMGLVRSFVPTQAAVKKQIEELIRLNIVERDSVVIGAYRYRV